MSCVALTITAYEPDFVKPNMLYSYHAYFFSLQLVLSDVRSKSRPVFHQSENYIFWSFLVNGIIRGCSEYTIPLKDLLGLVNSVALIITAHERFCRAKGFKYVYTILTLGLTIGIFRLSMS